MSELTFVMIAGAPKLHRCFSDTRTRTAVYLGDHRVFEMDDAELASFVAQAQQILAAPSNVIQTGNSDLVPATHDASKGDA